MSQEVYAVYDDANPTEPPVAWVPSRAIAQRIAKFLFGDKGRTEPNVAVARGIVRETGRALNGAELAPSERQTLFPTTVVNPFPFPLK